MAYMVYGEGIPNSFFPEAGLHKIKDEYRRGERVCSIVVGFHLREPGRIIGRAKAQYGKWTRYRIELEGDGTKIELPSDLIQSIEEEGDERDDV